MSGLEEVAFHGEFAQNQRRPQPGGPSRGKSRQTGSSFRILPAQGCIEVRAFSTGAEASGEAGSQDDFEAGFKSSVEVGEACRKSGAGQGSFESRSREACGEVSSENGSEVRSEGSSDIDDGRGR